VQVKIAGHGADRIKQRSDPLLAGNQILDPYEYGSQQCDEGLLIGHT
jgi:hypothetical protein